MSDWTSIDDPEEPGRVYSHELCLFDEDGHGLATVRLDHCDDHGPREPSFTVELADDASFFDVYAKDVEAGRADALECLSEHLTALLRAVEDAQADPPHILAREGGGIECTSCGGHYRMALPAPVELVSACMRAFMRRHRRCRAVPA